MAQDTQKKPWYQSKLILLGLTIVIVFGAQLGTRFLTGQGVTPEQIETLRLAAPQVADAVERIQGGENVLAVLGSLFGVVVMIFRAWFTSKAIA